MSSKVKEASKSSAELVDKPEAKIVSAKADDPIQYDDVYCRNTLKDTGVIPYSGGSPSRSPDIVPRQNNPYTNPDEIIADGNWDKDLGMDINAGQANYIYMRGMNLGTANSEDVKMYLYYSRSSLILWPQDPVDPTKGWKHNGIKTANAADYCVMGKNGVVKGSEKVATHDPFYWTPEPPPSGEHYCLIGRVATKTHPNEIPNDITSMGGMAGYICDHANMVWRNVTTIAPKNPVSTVAVAYDQGSDAETVHFYLKCTGLPVGSEVSFSAGTAGPNPAIKLEKTKVTSDEIFTAGVDTEVPAQYSTQISYTYYSNGLTPPDPSKFKIELKAVYIPDQSADNPLFAKATDISELGAPDYIVAKAQKRYGLGPTKGILVGTDQAMSEESIEASRIAYRNSAAKIPSKEIEHTFLNVTGAQWLNEQKSLFGSSFNKFNLGITSEVKSDLVVEELHLNSEKGSSSDPTLEVMTNFFLDSYKGDFHFSLKTDNVPKGCYIAFAGGTQANPIKLNKTEVSGYPSFTAGSDVELPEKFASNLNIMFYDENKQLESALKPKLIMSITHIVEDGDETEGYVSLETLGLKASDFAGPIKAKLLGQVTINLTPDSK